ncbi:glycosyltransferase [uncultured Luteimonas sp.]|uniref:glycosyltransferase n=1 Tax=uncultured Luteimonas sp. TaxID=453144 RepID=UPI002601FF21|nr:glycosyltransferase [uncultured Luteimonas sp.]
MPSIRILARGNGHGLAKDLDLLADLLGQAGYAVDPVGFHNEKGVRALQIGGMRLARFWRGRVDLQLSLEHVYPNTLSLARRNLLMPNPEWFRTRKWQGSLHRLDGMLCKTVHAQRIFSGMGVDARHVGFTSQDRRLPGVPRERMFLHLAGKSPVKGTEAVLEAWCRHPEWPTLVVVQTSRHARPRQGAANIDHRVGRLSDDELRILQNSCRFHVCPSEAEGFGHVLVEALGVGAVMLTTDGEPMNELVRPDYGVLIPPARIGQLGLARRFHVDAEGVERAVERVLGLPEVVVDAMSARARRAYEAIDRGFRTRMVEAVGEAITGTAAAAPLPAQRAA